MSDVVIYTANFGGYDQPRPQAEQDIDVEWVYVTDRDVDVPAPWQPLYLAVPIGPTPMLQSKWWKLHPPQGDVGYGRSIWIDSNMQVTSPSFAREAIAALHRPSYTIRPPAAALEALDYPVESAFAVWKHPRRDDYYDEAAAAVGPERQGDKYDTERLCAQAEAYLRSGMPRHTGLYACGTIVWTPAAREVGETWWDECLFWTPQDQVSLPFVCWARDVTPAVFPYPQLPQRFNRRLGCFANRWLRIYPHVHA